jgi:RNA polymerase sigma factor (sigma-70 family)
MSPRNDVLDLPAQRTSDAELFTAIVDRDEAAWRTAVERYEGLLFWTARRYRLTDEETADVVQETWARLLEHLDDIRDPERITGWLSTTAARQCLAAIRRRQREAPSPQECVDGIDTWDADDRLDAEQRGFALRRAIAALSPRERELMEVFLEPDPPCYAEISRRLSMPIGSIGPVRGRAMRRLRAMLEPEPEQDYELGRAIA